MTTTPNDPVSPEGESPRVPAEPPYGQVPPAPTYGQQPPYGQVPPAPTYGQQPPYGQVPPSPQYGQPPYEPAPQAPQYGGQPPYGQIPPAPQYGGQPPYAPVQPYAPVPVSIGEAFRFAWAAFKLEPLPWIVATLVMFVVSGIGQSIVNSMRRTAEWMDYTITFTTPGAWVVNLIFTIIGYAIAAGLIQAALRAADGRRTTFADFTSIPNLGQAMLAAVIFAVATNIGYAMLFLPGLVIQVLGAWYLHLALDRGLSAVDALKASVQLVTQNLGTTLLFGLAAVGVMILGALALGVGLLVAAPMVVLASVFVFRRITGGAVMVPGSA